MYWLCAVSTSVSSVLAVDQQTSLLVYSGSGATLFVVSLPTLGAVDDSQPQEQVLFGHSSPVATVCIRDGNILSSSRLEVILWTRSPSGYVQAWNHKFAFVQCDSMPVCAQFSPYGRRCVVTVGSEATIFDVTPAADALKPPVRHHQQLCNQDANPVVASSKPSGHARTSSWLMQQLTATVSSLRTSIIAGPKPVRASRSGYAYAATAAESITLASTHWCNVGQYRLADVVGSGLFDDVTTAARARIVALTHTKKRRLPLSSALEPVDETDCNPSAPEAEETMMSPVGTAVSNENQVPSSDARCKTPAKTQAEAEGDNQLPADADMRSPLKRRRV